MRTIVISQPKPTSTSGNNHGKNMSKREGLVNHSCVIAVKAPFFFSMLIFLLPNGPVLERLSLRPRRSRCVCAVSFCLTRMPTEFSKAHKPPPPFYCHLPDEEPADYVNLVHCVTTPLFACGLECDPIWSRLYERAPDTPGTIRRRGSEQR